MTGTTHGEKSRWPLIVGGTVVILALLLIVGSLVVKRQLERGCVNALVFELAELQSVARQNPEPAVFERCLAVLEGSRDRSLDPARTQMMLPTVRAWFYDMGFTTITVSETQAEDLEEKAVAVLAGIVGKDLGRDPAAWREWLTARTMEKIE